MDLIKAAVMGVVEGLTEFIPVSSTGHLIVAGHLMRFDPPYASTFEVFIQLGAILSVVVLYWDRFLGLLDFKKEGFAGFKGLWLLFLTTLPALVFGALAHGYIKAHLFSPMTVAIGLFAGGIAILALEKSLPEPRSKGLDSLTWKHALLVGFFQCFSLWPGVSRAASTILGAMLIRVDRQTAAEYSFLAAVPVMCAAVGYDMLKSAATFSADDAGVFALGFVVSFVTAGFAVRTFVRFLGSSTLSPFGWYRVAVAPAIFFFLK